MLQVIGETLPAFRLSKVEKWDQEFTYGTIRRKISVQDFVV